MMVVFQTNTGFADFSGKEEPVEGWIDSIASRFLAKQIYAPPW